jgi:hypothetical protein
LEHQTSGDGEDHSNRSAMKANQAAFDVGQLAMDMAQGYSAHSAALSIVKRLDEKTLHRVTWWNEPVGTAPTKDGTPVCFNLRGFLKLASKNPAIAAELPLVWLRGSLLAVGDALACNRYFDRAPELELIRYLRNGIAHGNLFKIQKDDQLVKRPAHNRDVWPRRPGRGIFEITSALNGQCVLFDFMEAGDVIEALHDVGVYLKRLGNGEPPPRRTKKVNRKDRATRGATLKPK